MLVAPQRQPNFQRAGPSRLDPCANIALRISEVKPLALNFGYPYNAAMSDAIAESKRTHDAERQSRAVLVRLSEDEAALADRLCRAGESRPALLRRLLNERAPKRSKSRQRA